MTYGPEGGAFGGDVFVPGSRQGGDQQASVSTGVRPTIKSGKASIVNGALQASVGPPNPGAAWEVGRITVQASDNSTFPTCYIYVSQDGNTDPQNLVSGTNAGAFDENDTNRPIFVPEGYQMTARWSHSTGTASFRIEYTEL